MFPLFYHKKSYFLILALALFVSIAMGRGAWAAADQALLVRTKQVSEELLKDLETLVNRDSPSDYGEGVARVRIS